MQTPPDPGHARKPASYSAVHIPLQRRFCSQPLCQAVEKWAHTGETHLLSWSLDCKGGDSCPGCCGLEGRGFAGWQRRHRVWLRGRHLHCRNCQGIAHIHPPTAFPVKGFLSFMHHTAAAWRCPRGISIFAGAKQQLGPALKKLINVLAVLLIGRGVAERIC